MFSLINGKSKFYIGKINGIGYTSEEEKKTIIENLGDVEIKDEPVKIDKDLKEKAERLGELQLTYSKSEFIDYLIGKKSIPDLELKELKESNKELQFALIKANMELYQTLAVMEEQYKLENAKQLMDILELVSTIEGGEE